MTSNNLVKQALGWICCISFLYDIFVILLNKLLALILYSFIHYMTSNNLVKQALGWICCISFIVLLNITKNITPLKKNLILST